MNYAMDVLIFAFNAQYLIISSTRQPRGVLHPMPVKWFA